MSSDKLANIKNDKFQLSLFEEADWAAHLSLPAIVFDMNHLKSESLINFCRFLSILLHKHSTKIWLLCELHHYSLCLKIFQFCNFHEQLFVTLYLPEDIPLSESDNETVIRFSVFFKWFGLKLKALYLKTSIFTSNRNGYPILSFSHQKLILNLLSKYDDLKLIITEVCDHNEGISVFKEYLDRLLSKLNEESTYTKFTKDYRDVLQKPLQPLQDDLKNEMYETFEKDPVKYEKYQQAIEKAMIFKLKERQKNDDDDYKKKIKIMVVGCGRAPLVKNVIAVCQKLEISSNIVEIYALDKNINAIRTTQQIKKTFSKLENNSVQGRIKANLWQNLKILHSDMRIEFDKTLKGEIDIVISELLGSFGDNELSPECLNECEWMLNERSISIPSSYTSYVSPISYSLGWKKLDNFDDKKYFETIYVANLYQHHRLAPSKPCFTFHHPNSQIENTKVIKLSFKCTCDSILHGFGGYFTATLFADVKISTNPSEEYLSPDMFSWFPCFIPLSTPIKVNNGDVIEFWIWRMSSETKVWYEWCVVQPVQSKVHNTAGKSSCIGLLSQ